MIRFFRLFLFFFSILCSLLIPTKVFAEIDYVLPYPSLMPGSKLYVLQEFKNSTLQYWYFGDFGQFTYCLKQSDKFLVEAKTLFEYKQYLLADRALEKSNYFFKRTYIFLDKAEKKNKDISQKKTIINNASIKHVEILIALRSNLPDVFIWTPEKSSPTELNIKQNINEAIKIRSGKI